MQLNLLVSTLGVALIPVAGSTVSAQALSPIEELGKALYFDENLSVPPGQSCATCHAPEAGFAGPDSTINLEQGVYPGAVHTRAGNRKPPTAAYGGESPILYWDTSDGDGLWIGGMFWDGRATGEILGDPLADQAGGPFLNSLEQNSPTKKLVCRKVAKSDYADLFEQVWGSVDFVKDVDLMYDRIALSIAAFEASPEVNPFSSKYDAYLAGQAVLTAEELLGLQLFNDPFKGNCAACHPSELGLAGEPPLFTDFSFDNLGTPKNPNNPFYDAKPKVNPDGAAWIDPGLGGFMASSGLGDPTPEWGKHKVPTLRNVDKRPYDTFVKAYMHNGVFTSLKEVVHFYNTRDVATQGWAPPEVEANVNVDELGNLGLTPAEEDAIVAFMKTLTDGWTPPVL